jgi:hypothetical protein
MQLIGASVSRHGALGGGFRSARVERDVVP